MQAQSRALVSCLFLSLLASIGCSGARRTTIAVIPRDTAEEIYVSEHGGAADAAYTRHLSIYWNGPSRDDDVEQQIALSERAIQSRDYGLILSPNNSFALDTVIQRALAHKIPVVILGAQIPVSEQRGLVFVTNDAKRMGLLAAARARDLLHGKGKVAILGIDSLSPGSVERSDAFERALRREAPAITVAEKLVGPFSFGQAELATEQAIQAHADLSLIFALGIPETSGASAAVRSTGTSNHIRIIGCDQTLDLLFQLRHGLIDSLVIENTRTMGQLAVERIAAERRGEAVPASTLVEPYLVTRQNVDEEPIQKVLSLRWRPEP